MNASHERIRRHAEHPDSRPKRFLRFHGTCCSNAMRGVNAFFPGIGDSAILHSISHVQPKGICQKPLLAVIQKVTRDA